MFTYEPLPTEGSEIRLVRFLEPSDTRLSLELRHASMDNTDYAAVSYVWGDVKDTIEITVNGSSFNIGRNLHTGLEQLRDNGVQGWLWIDSICIQQSDLDEKSYQVGQMRAIFSNATRVYSWLGPGSSISNAAMDFISRIGPRAIECRALDRAFRDERVIAYLDNPSSHEASEDDDRIWEFARLIHDILHEPELRGKTYGDEGLAAGIQRLMQRDYWHRIWINQEIALAKEVVILCGTKAVPLDLLEAALHVVDDCYARYRFYGHGTRDFARGLHSNFSYNLAMETRRWHLRGSEIELDSLLFNRMAPPDRPFYSATDPRDIIFGLLGIITDNDRLGIRVDYRASMAEVFTATTRAFIERGRTHHGSYTLDCCVPKEELVDGLPSWVPDWREVGTEGVAEDPVNLLRLFDATPKIPVPPVTRAETEDSLGILRRQGCRVDVVTEVMQPHKETYDTDHAAMDHQNAESRLQSILGFTNLGAECGPAEDYVWRVLLSPNWYRRINASTAEDIAVLIRKIMRRSPIDGDSLTSKQKTFIRDLRDFWNKSPEEDTFSAQLANARKSLQEHERHFNRQRTLFKTAKGMLGLGHKVVRPGDVVVLLWGVQVPIILRPREARGFTFAGDAYVDGIMHGEFLEARPAHVEFEIY